MNRYFFVSKNVIITALLLFFLLGMGIGWCLWEWMKLVMMIVA